MQRAKYAPEFKDEAVKQVIDKGHSVVDVAKRLGIAEGVLYTWVSKFKKADEPSTNDLKVLQAEMAKLKAELRRTTEERDILKKAALDSTGHCNAAFSVSAGQSYPNVFRGLPLSFEATSLSCSWV